VRAYSDIFGWMYDTEYVRFIPNMKQNCKYLKSGQANGELVDIICGEDDRLVFVWKKSKIMNDLYVKWCNHEL